MNLDAVGNFIFHFFNFLVLLTLSIIFCTFTFSLFFFPIIVAIIVTVQNNFILNKGYFYKTFFSTFMFVTKKYFKTCLMFYILLLLLSFLLFFALTNPITPFFIFGLGLLSSVLYCILLVSANICTIQNMSTPELLAQTILVIKKHYSFVLSILVITFGMIYIFLHSNLLTFIVLSTICVFIIPFILYYGITRNYIDLDTELE